MKTAYLIRHAKSSRADSSGADIERPIADRGRRDAPRMGRRLVERGVRFDALYTSPAVRARQTAELLLDSMSVERNVMRTARELYATDADSLLAFLRRLPDSLDSVALVIHNPETTDIANRLGTESVENVPTCGVCALGFAVERWADIDEATGRTLFFDFPKKEQPEK